MFSEQSLNLGATAQSSTEYVGQHRDNYMLQGIGFIPLGDRNRDRPEFGIDYAEERMSVDKYSKYTT